MRCSRVEQVNSEISAVEDRLSVIHETKSSQDDPSMLQNTIGDYAVSQLMASLLKQDAGMAAQAMHISDEGSKDGDLKIPKRKLRICSAENEVLPPPPRTFAIDNQ